MAAAATQKATQEATQEATPEATPEGTRSVAATHAAPRCGRRLPILLVLVAVLAAAVLVLGPRLLAGASGHLGSDRSAGAGSGGGGRLAEALAELRRWDALRATAYAAGDPQRLSALYVEGSPAAVADVEILESYAARGLVVDRMRTQVLEAEPVRLEDDRITLRVQDRLVGAEAVDEDGRRLALPRDEVSTRRLTLVRVGEEWLMQEVDQE